MLQKFIKKVSETSETVHYLCYDSETLRFQIHERGTDVYFSYGHYCPLNFADIIKDNDNYIKISHKVFMTKFNKAVKDFKLRSKIMYG